MWGTGIKKVSTLGGGGSSICVWSIEAHVGQRRQMQEGDQAKVGCQGPSRVNRLMCRRARPVWGAGARAMG